MQATSYLPLSSVSLRRLPMQLFGIDRGGHQTQDLAGGTRKYMNALKAKMVVPSQFERQVVESADRVPTVSPILIHVEWLVCLGVSFVTMVFEEESCWVKWLRFTVGHLHREKCDPPIGLAGSGGVFGHFSILLPHFYTSIY